MGSGDAVAFAHCMCRECFVEYLKTSGGIYEVRDSSAKCGAVLQCGGNTAEQYVGMVVGEWRQCSVEPMWGGTVQY